MSFSVKWKTSSPDGTERHRIFSTDQFQYAGRNSPPHGAPEAHTPKLGVYNVPPDGLVVIGNPHCGADSIAFGCGTIYVMNEAGKTVATYHLGEGDYEIAEIPKQ